MTVLRVVTESERLSETQRSELAEALTAAVLDVEVGVDNPVGRTGVMVLFDEFAKERWAVGGHFDDSFVSPPGRMLIEARVMEGVWTPERRSALLMRFYDAVAKAFGVPRDSAFGTCWVLFQQIEDGGWGALGRPLSITDILSPAAFSEDRQDDARRLLADRK
jgi:phenylpyruvate tautomerase PptA (4-oxalocrotonate tautomerase family)